VNSLAGLLENIIDQASMTGTTALVWVLDRKTTTLAAGVQLIAAAHVLVVIVSSVLLLVFPVQ